MNDLAEKALLGLDAARQQVRGRPMLSFAVTGFLVAAAVVITGGRVGAAGPTRPLTTWLGLQDQHRAGVHDTLFGALLLIAILLLLLLWIGVVAYVARHPQPVRRVWQVAAAWAVPLAIGPPLLDNAVYGYAGYGLLQRAGHDPYTEAPTRLGEHAVVAALDPGARGTPSASGPLGTLVQHLAVTISSGSALGAVLVLRVVAVLAAAWIGARAVDLAAARYVDPPGGRRGRALTLTVLNPVLLLYVVSAAHLDGLMIALVLTALAFAAQRRWLAAAAAGSLAGCVLGQGWLVVLVIVLAHWHATQDRPRARRLGAAARELGVAVAFGVGLSFAVPHGFGWITSLPKQFSTHTPYSVAGAIGTVLTPVVRGASYDDLAIGGRLTALTAMVCVVAYLLVTARRRTPELTAAWVLLAIALLAPSLFPWYLLWATMCLAPTANTIRRGLVLVLAAAACALSPTGFTPTITDVITGVLLGVIALVVLVGYRLSAAGDPPDRGSHVGEVHGRDDDRDQRQRAVVDAAGERADRAGDHQDQ